MKKADTNGVHELGRATDFGAGIPDTAETIYGTLTAKLFGDYTVAKGP